MQGKETVRVLLADDHSAVRDGIKAYLDTQPGIKVVGEARDGEEAIRKTKELHPDILVLDVAMPRVNGLDAAKQIQRLGLAVKIIALSVYDNNEYVAGLVRAGARGYISKSDPPSMLVNAIRTVANGGTVFSPSAAQVLLDDYVKNAETLGEVSDLSKREKEILGQIAQGYTNAEIGKNYDISRRTVETHRLHIRRKLEMETTADLIKYAVLNGLVPDDAVNYKFDDSSSPSRSVRNWDCEAEAASAVAKMN